MAENWDREFNATNEEMKHNMLIKSFKMIYRCTKATKIRNFQFRLLHKIIGINDKLHIWGIKENYLCDLCQGERETYHHLVCTFEKTIRLWSDIKEWTRQTIGHSLETTPISISSLEHKKQKL